MKLKPKKREDVQEIIFTGKNEKIIQRDKKMTRDIIFTVK